ncbi:CC_3452 family protein [Sphingomicrobium flavum]|uniref:CC_3452 family protein n=1 Tax=Sphingomicrobium flavum TaxID=1229164 RepID=UPI0021ADAE11|nr:hypothetical protein [Sphingomicrobium flavum]
MRTLIALSALLASAPAFAAVPVMTATPEAGVEGRIITKGASWNCTAAGCKAASDSSRPMVLCQRLAREVGTLAAFEVDGRAFDAEQLAKCNAKAS